MFNIENVDLTFSFSPVLFFTALAVLAGYAIYVYRYTVPQVSAAKKTLLVSLRTLALLLLLFIIFEPILTLAKKNIIEPVNLFFVDNSRSINIEDGTNRKENINNFINEIESSLKNSFQLFAFGNETEEVSFDSVEFINFESGVTNFSKIFSSIDKGRNISSITIISDGVITEGANPLFTAEKLNIPVYTVGVGDTTKKRDIEVANVLFNEFIYVETPTTIQAAVLNNGFAGTNISAKLLENDKVIEQKNISLSESGVQNVSFNYTPQTGGEKKLTIAVTNIEGENTFANNRKIFYVNVLDTKINVLILAGSPSSDLSFIKNSLKLDENLKVNSITQIAANKFLEKENRDALIDSADVFFLVGFPSQETPHDMLNKVVKLISEKNIPYFLTLSGNADMQRLREIQGILPFTISGSFTGYFEVQPLTSSDESSNPLLQNNSPSPLSSWNSLPPVYQPNNDFAVKAEGDAIARSKVNNVPLNKPLIITSRLGSKRSIAILAKDIWKWKLQTATKELDLFDNFIFNSVKWLNTSEDQKQVSIKTSKKLYALGEDVEFAAQVYDAAFNPVNDAEVKINIRSGEDNYEINLSSIGSGLYEGAFQTNAAGDYTFSGSAYLNGKKLGDDAGRFNMGEVDIEMVDTRMNYEFLNSLANQTNGEFFTAPDYKPLFDILKQRTLNASKEKINVSEINLWSNEWLMVIVILLFALEWFFRKRAGML